MSVQMGLLEAETSAPVLRVVLYGKQADGTITAVLVDATGKLITV